MIQSVQKGLSNNSSGATVSAMDDEGALVISYCLVLCSFRSDNDRNWLIIITQAAHTPASSCQVTSRAQPKLRSKSA